jgi:hypothetical protein
LASSSESVRRYSATVWPRVSRIAATAASAASRWLYCALEDSERRLKSRMEKLLGVSREWPLRLFHYCQLPRLAEGGLDAIRDWIKSQPHPRMVIIDTLAMVRPPKKRDETNYDADYAAVLTLRELAAELGVAIVLVHHLRKAEADDAFDTVSGTLGLTGAPDSVLILKRDSSGHTVLHGKGRDMVEIEKAIEFDTNACIWRITGDASDVRLSCSKPSSRPPRQSVLTTSPPKPACGRSTSAACSPSWSRKARSRRPAMGAIGWPKCDRCHSQPVTLPVTLDRSHYVSWTGLD